MLRQRSASTATAFRSGNGDDAVAQACHEPRIGRTAQADGAGRGRRRRAERDEVLAVGVAELATEVGGNALEERDDGIGSRARGGEGDARVVRGIQEAGEEEGENDVDGVVEARGHDQDRRDEEKDDADTANEEWAEAG